MIEKTSKKTERTISAVMALEIPSLAPDESKLSPVGSLGIIKKSRIFSLGCFLVFLFAIFLAQSVSAIANQISFQGKLTDSSGSLVTDGTYYLKFSIYDAASGGSCQYTAAGSCGSATTTPVALTSGIFSVNLGDTDSGLNVLPSSLFNADVLYLGITVCSGPNTGCDAEMTPRKRITASPYAFNADRLSGLATSTQGGDSSYIPATDATGNLSLSNSLFLATSTAGQLGIGTSTVPSGYKAYLESATAADKLLVIRANASQVGSLTEWQSSTGSSLLSIDPTGNLSTSGTLSIFGNLDRINDVSYLWPSSQGAADTYLKNDGSGGLTWATVSGGSGVNDWGRFSQTYGVNALMTSSSYPVWFDNVVGASSSVKITGEDAYLDVGGEGNGIASLFVGATSSDSIPLILRGPAGGTGRTSDTFFDIQDSSGNSILNFSTTTYDPLVSQAAWLTIGGNGHPGFLGLTGDGSGQPGMLQFYDTGNTYLQGSYDGKGWELSDDYGNSTSSLSLNGDDAGLYLFQQDGFDQGTFNVVSSGNLSTSGTLSIFGNLDRINDVSYLWPSSQGAADTYLKNDGSGGLTWATVSGGSGVNDWGRFSQTYGVNALMTSSSYPVWFDNNVFASSSVLISGDDSSLNIGANGNGIAQLFIQASSSEALPLGIQGPIGGTGNKDDTIIDIVDAYGSSIFSFATTTNFELEQAATLSIGSEYRDGYVVFRGGYYTTGGAVVMLNESEEGFQSFYGRQMMSISNINQTTTSSLETNKLNLFQQTGYDAGTFSVDFSGDISTSGTLAVYGGEIFVQSVESTDKPLIIRSNSTQASSLTEWQDSLGNKLGSVASTTVAIDGFSESGLVLSLGNNYEESDPAFFHGGLAIDGDNFYDANTFIIHDSIFLTADAGNSSIFNSHYLSLGKASSTDGSAGLIYLDGDDGTFSASNTIQNFVVSGGGSDDYWQKWLDTSGNILASLASSTFSYTKPAEIGSSNFEEASVLTLGNDSKEGVLYLKNDGRILFNSDGVVAGLLNGSDLYLSDPFDDEVTATTTYGYKEIVFVQDEGYDQGYFHMDDSGNISTSGSIRLFGDLGSPSYNTGFSLFSVSDDGSVVTNTIQSFVGDAAGSTGFAFDTVASGGAMTSGTTDRMLAVFQNNGVNKVGISAGGNVYAANSFIANSTDYGIGDVAEYVNLVGGTSVEAGDVLVVDITGSNVYKKSDVAYAKNVAGVVSDTGKFVMGASGASRAPLALAGLVKVKVTNENGAINPGDYLITASKPGYAMKYDPANSLSSAGLVGMALESLIDAEGQITILVNKGLVAGTSNNVTMSVNDSGQLISNNNLDLAGSGIINVGSIVAASGMWQIDSEGKIIAKSLIADKVQTRELVLSKDQAQESTVGEATILNGQQSVEVLNTNIKKNSKIFVTFRGNPGSFWWIGNQEDGKFSVFLSSSAAQDTTFDYWLVTIDEENTTVTAGSEVIPGANNSNPFTNLPPVGSTTNGSGSTESSDSNNVEGSDSSTSVEENTTTQTDSTTSGDSSEDSVSNESGSVSSDNSEAATEDGSSPDAGSSVPSIPPTEETSSETSS